MTRTQIRTTKMCPQRPVRGMARWTLLGLVAAALVGAGLWYGLQSSKPIPAAKRDPLPGVMSEAERLEYVKKHVRVEGLTVDTDRKPASDEVVPGLLRVKGEVQNDGPREVEKVVLWILPKDAEGNVLGAHFENVVNKGGAFKPGQKRSFSFTIPDKKAFEGAFDTELR